MSVNGSQYMTHLENMTFAFNMYQYPKARKWRARKLKPLQTSLNKTCGFVKYILQKIRKVVFEGFPSLPWFTLEIISNMI